MRFRKAVMFRRICTLLFLLAELLLSQTDTGLVTGFVTDPSGSAIINATVTLRSPDTGRVYTAKTGETGSYTIGAVIRGTYDLTVEAAGFAKAEQKGLVVNLGARLQADVALKIGDITETVEVTAATPLLESQSSSVGQVVENKTVVTLPLNGRNYSQLALLMPGASPNSGSRATDGFSLNGQRTFQNVFLVDGVDNNNYILGVDTNSTQALRPSVDAIQEFKVDSATYSAEFGRAAGGVISVSIKSGTNEFRGSAFEFLRNDKLDANNFFSNRSRLKRPPLRRNQYGGTFGGPVLKDRTFFFVSYQGTMVRQSKTMTSTVPTGNMATGDFGSVAIYDPLQVSGGVRAQFAGNVIPANRLDPVGAKLAALYPKANLAGTVNNYAANVGVPDDDHQGDARIDHRLTQKDTIFVRAGVDRRTITQGAMFAPPGNGGNGFNDYPLLQTPQAWSVIGNWTRLVSASTVNEFRTGFTRNESDQLSPAASSLYDSFGLKGVPATAGLTGLPQFTVSGFASLGDRTFAPNPKRTGVFQLIDNATWIRGNHTIKFGFDSRFTDNFAGTSSNARGNISVNGQFTSRTPGTGAGSALADLLLGQTSSAQLTSLLIGDLRNNYYGYFVNDSWKITRKLTLNLGVRYELQSPYWETQNKQGNFDANPASPTYGTVVAAKDGGYREKAFINLDKNNFAPRIGLAYQLTPKTVIRSATGIFYGGWGFQAIAQMGPANPPYFLNVTLASSSTSSVSQMVLGTGYPADMLSPARLANPAAVTVPSDFPISTIYQWNFSVQQELPAAMAFTAAYVGSSSNFLPGFMDINDALPGAGAVNPRRPFTTYGGITLNGPFAHASYHSLQGKLERRFTAGFSLLGSYTLSHGMDNSINGEDNAAGSTLPQNPRNLRAERSASATDIRNRFVTSGIWDIPVGRSNGILGNNAVARALLGGWQMAGILTLQTGVPLTPTVSVNPANTTGPVRPDRLADGNLSADQRTIDRWFDRTAFAAATPFNFGNSGRHVIRAPGLKTIDGSVNRNFRIGEQRRLEFRWEMFNLTNTAQFGRPNLNINLAQGGTITSTSVPNRNMQLGMRLVF
jgi:hypothetical protein